MYVPLGQVNVYVFGIVASHPLFQQVQAPIADILEPETSQMGVIRARKAFPSRE
jgi:hypothetical protein